MDPLRRPPYKIAGLATFLVLALVGVLVYLQFHGQFTSKVRLTMVASRSGLVLEPGSKVTYNGVQIGRVGSISEIDREGKPAAKLVLEVDPQYIKLIPANVQANITATTVFGNKYVSFTSPKNPAPQRITPAALIDARSVTTEFNTLFETLTSIAEKVDPVKVNLTLSAAAQALSGLGDRFGGALINGNAVLDNINPQMDLVRRDIQRFADLGDTYANASPPLWDFLADAARTARTLTRQQDDLDAALLAGAGLGNTGADVLEHGGPYLQRGAADLLPTAGLLDEYSPEIFCTIRNYHDIQPIIHRALGAGNGYSVGAKSAGGIVGAPSPYIYPENLPRVNARGGPGGTPGCWQPITRDLWPAPLLVMDAGASVAPYNHFEIGSPVAVDYVWGRQLGDYTINP
jgi:phospholipid/cholesterol/gamma-HCH transport system substrate-binding protein